MPERVYIETTVVSYLTARPNRDVVIAAHQQLTHEWWDQARADFELCTSQLVLQEAGSGGEEPSEWEDHGRVLLQKHQPELQHGAFVDSPEKAPD